MMAGEQESGWKYNLVNYLGLPRENSSREIPAVLDKVLLFPSGWCLLWGGEGPVATDGS